MLHAYPTLLLVSRLLSHESRMSEPLASNTAPKKEGVTESGLLALIKDLKDGEHIEMMYLEAPLSKAKYQCHPIAECIGSLRHSVTVTPSLPSTSSTVALASASRSGLVLGHRACCNLPLTAQKKDGAAVKQWAVEYNAQHGVQGALMPMVDAQGKIVLNGGNVQYEPS